MEYLILAKPALFVVDANKKNTSWKYLFMDIAIKHISWETELNPNKSNNIKVVNGLFPQMTFELVRLTFQNEGDLPPYQLKLLVSTSNLLNSISSVRIVQELQDLPQNNMTNNTSTNNTNTINNANSNVNTTNNNTNVTNVTNSTNSTNVTNSTTNSTLTNNTTNNNINNSTNTSNNSSNNLISAKYPFMNNNASLELFTSLSVSDI